MINKYIRKDLKDCQPYYSPTDHYKVKLDANENPFPLPQNLKQEFIKWFQSENNLNRYPDTNSTELRKELGKHWNINKDNVICGVGSDQLIDCMMKAFLEPKDKVLIPNPSFSMYTLTTQMNHGIPVTVSLKNNYDYEVDDILTAYYKYKPKIIILCTPNNPTGNELSIQNIEQIISQVSCPVLVDEAYGEFTNISMIPFIKKYSHLFIIRTFSKAFGLAGIRLGYGVGSQEIINAISITKPPFNINILSEKMALFALKQIPTYDKQIRILQNEKKWLEEQLKLIGCTVYPSKANFLLVQIKHKDLYKNLKERNILVRNFSTHPHLSYCIRITVGTREENTFLIKAIKDIINSKKGNLYEQEKSKD